MPYKPGDEHKRGWKHPPITCKRISLGKRIPIEVRLQKWIKKDEKTGCWNWTGVNIGGYGYIHIRFPNEKNFRIHRFIYELKVGKIPKNLQLDHLCKNKLCCNPKHLEPVSAKVNNERNENSPTTINSKKICCPKGHKLVKFQYTRYGKKGIGRKCSICQKRQIKNWYLKHRQLKTKGLYGEKINTNQPISSSIFPEQNSSGKI